MKWKQTQNRLHTKGQHFIENLFLFHTYIWTSFLSASDLYTYERSQNIQEIVKYPVIRIWISTSLQIFIKPDNNPSILFTYSISLICHISNSKFIRESCFLPVATTQASVQGIHISCIIGTYKIITYRAENQMTVFETVISTTLFYLTGVPHCFFQSHLRWLMSHGKLSEESTLHCILSPDE